MDKVIQIKGLTQRFGQLTVLRNVDLDVYSGEVLGLLGPSGSGKTTLIKAIVGMNRPTTGTISLDGISMPSLKVMQSIGYMAQSDALYDDLNAYDNLLFFGALYGLKGQKAKKRIDEVLSMVHLTEHAKRLVHTYSGGMKRRLSLAAALLHHPKVLILDEPTVGIDPVLRMEFWNEFENIRTTGTAILITTHAMDEAEHCQRLALIRDGVVMAVGTPDELKSMSKSNTIEGAFLHFSVEGGEINL